MSDSEDTNQKKRHIKRQVSKMWKAHRRIAIAGRRGELPLVKAIMDVQADYGKDYLQMVEQAQGGQE